MHHVAVLAAQPDGLAALRRDPADDLLVDGAGQHHLDDLDRGLVGDAQARLELALDPEPLQHRPDLRSAAVHHDGFEARLLEQNDVLGEILRRRLVAHGVPAVLDDHHLLVVALHVRQSLHEDLGALVRGGGHAGGGGLGAGGGVGHGGVFPRTKSVSRAL